MSFSYGYHFCKDNKLNCIRQVIDPPPDRRLMALRELKATAEDIQKIIEEFEEQLGKDR